MKKKLQNNSDLIGFMTKIQEQLAVLDKKLDTFMTKSLTELAQARAVQKPLHYVQPPPQTVPRQNQQRPARPMFAVICFDCGKDTEIPFKPSGDRPVYCKECFARRRSGQSPKVNAEQKPSAPNIEPTASSVSPVTPTVSKKNLIAGKKSSAKSAKKKVVAKKKNKKK